MPGSPFLFAPVWTMADSRKIKLTLAYDGTRYHGWQLQRNGLTIQEVLEDKLRVMTREPVRVFGSGRTDAGVHALGQVCHFETRSRLEPEELQRGLNSLLPDDVHVVRAEAVHPGFHARYDARSKVYEYRILNRPEPDVFLHRYTWHISRPLRREAMSQGLACLRGEHDFSSFRSAGSGNRNPVRRMLHVELREAESGLIHVDETALGFTKLDVQHAPDGVPVAAARRPEGGEVVLAPEAGQTLTHGFPTQGAGDVPGVTMEKDVRLRPVQDPVLVHLAPGVVAGVEPGMHRLGPHHVDVVGQQAVEASLQLLGLEA